MDLRRTLRDGANQGRNQLVLDHRDLVFAIAWRVWRHLPPQFELPDLASAGMLGLIEAASRFRPRAGAPIDQQFPRFARPRIHGAILDSVRRKQYREATHDRLSDVPEHAELDPEYHQRECACDLDRAMQCLSPAELHLLDLHYWQGYSFADAASKLGLSQTGAFRMHQAATLKLRAALAWNALPGTGDVLGRVPKPIQINSGKTPKPPSRVEVVDELGALEQKLEPLLKRRTVLVAEIRAWADLELKPAHGTVYQGKKYVAAVSARGNRRRVADMLKLFTFLGKQKFLGFCGFTVEKAQKCLTEVQFNEVVVEDTHISPRDVEMGLRSSYKQAA